MAETSANDAAQRYAVIEQAYSREKWATVLGDGGELLQELRQSDNPQLNGLKLRLQLLLGHTQLYGYGDKAAAAGYYGTVADQSSEAALTRIAEQGLKQCAIDEGAAAPTAGAAVADGVATAPAFLAEAAAGPVVTAQGSNAPAAPWLAATAAAVAATAAAPTPAAGLEPAPAEVGVAAAAAATPAAPWSEPSLIPEVVEEPELIELHQADPALADDVELSWQESSAGAAAPMDKEDEELLSGLMLVRVR
jgi:hypothetical protein